MLKKILIITIIMMMTIMVGSHKVTAQSLTNFTSATIEYQNTKVLKVTSNKSSTVSSLDTRKLKVSPVKKTVKKTVTKKVKEAYQKKVWKTKKVKKSYKKDGKTLYKWVNERYSTTIKSYRYVKKKVIEEKKVTVKNHYQLKALDYGQVNVKVKSGKTTAKVLIKIPTIQINKKSLSLKVGETSQLSLSNNKSKITWKSSHKSVTVSSKGVVKAHAVGKSVLTASVGKKTFTCQVNVIPSSNKINARVGTTLSVKKLLTSSLNYKAPQYISSNQKVALVDGTGLVMPVSAGECTITLKNNGQFVKSIQLKISDPGNVKVGVDLSHWNGKVNFNTLKNNGISFAIIKAGQNKQDEKLNDYIKGCKSAGIDYGVYWYLSTRDAKRAMNEADAKNRAEMLLSILKETKLSTKIWLDIEDETLFTGIKGDSAITKHNLAVTKAFVNTLLKNGVKKQQIGIYSYKNYFEHYLNDSYFAGFDLLWYARYIESTQPAIKIAGKYYKPKLWQTGSRYKIEGIPVGEVDMNYWYM